MYPRLPSDGGPATGYKLPSFSPRFYMPPGIPALAIGAGKVLASKDTNTGGYVEIQHDNGLTSQYMHLRNLRVSPGDAVRSGQAVGDISYNPADFALIHLHFQLRRNGQLIDPRPVIGSWPIINAPIPPLLVAAIVGGGGYWAYRAWKKG